MQIPCRKSWFACKTYNMWQTIQNAHAMRIKILTRGLRVDGKSWSACRTPLTNGPSTRIPLRTRLIRYWKLGNPKTWQTQTLLNRFNFFDFQRCVDYLEIWNLENTSTVAVRISIESMPRENGNWQRMHWEKRIFQNTLCELSGVLSVEQIARV